MIKERNTYFRGGVEVRPSTPEEREQYLYQFGEVIDILHEVAGNEGWWVIGGLARDAALGNEEFVVQDPHGNHRDVDVLFTDSKAKLIGEVKRKYNGPIPIGGAGVQQFVSIPENCNESEVELRFGAIREKVPGKVFSTVNARLRDTDFPTLPVQTLFHLYALGDRPDGKMREKDYLNAFDLARHIKNCPSDEYPEDLYQNFHIFARKKNLPGRNSLTSRARGLARSYKESPFNKILPITGKNILPIAQKVYDWIQQIEIKLTKESSDIR